MGVAAVAVAATAAVAFAVAAAVADGQYPLLLLQHPLLLQVLSPLSRSRNISIPMLCERPKDIVAVAAVAAATVAVAVAATVAGGQPPPPLLLQRLFLLRVLPPSPDPATPHSPYHTNVPNPPIFSRSMPAISDR